MRAARRNARRNRRRNVAFEVARVEERLDAIADFTPDVATMNPPRKGCGVAVASALVRARVPRLLYLSCDATTFARDAATLVAGGYRLRSVQPFDLIPQTEHIELLGAFVHERARQDAAFSGDTTVGQ